MVTLFLDNNRSTHCISNGLCNTLIAKVQSCKFLTITLLPGHHDKIIEQVAWIVNQAPQIFHDFIGISQWKEQQK